jgi:hypothetical protein
MFAVDYVPPPPPVVHVRPIGSATVGIPEVATTASDGLPSVLRPGRHRLGVRVLLNASAAPRSGRLDVDGHACTSVVLPAGAVVTLPCSAVARPGTTVTVRVVAGGQVVRTWRHRVAR